MPNEDVDPTAGSEDDDLISDVARERRRNAERETTEPRPDFVVAVEQSEVLYTLEPLAMPFRTVDADRLVPELADRYDLSLGTLNYSPLLATMSREQLSQLTESEAMGRLLKAKQGQLEFESGKYRLRDDFVLVRHVSVNFESILVSVAGTTAVAKAVAQDVLELMWKLAGSVKRWDQDLEPRLMLEAYGTATRVQLPGSPEALISPEVMAVVSTQIGQGGLGTRMGNFKAAVAGDVIANTFLDDVTFRISKFDQLSGSASAHSLSVSVTAKSDYGSGRVLITSELDYDDHIALVGEMVSAMTPS